MEGKNFFIKRLNGFFKASVITFIAGALLGTALQIFFEHAIIGNLLILLILLSIYIAYTIATIESANGRAIQEVRSMNENTIQEVKSMNENTIQEIGKNHTKSFDTLAVMSKDIIEQAHLLGLNTYWHSNTLTEDEGYEISSQIVRRARKSIYIISDYSPKDRRIIPTDEREKYFHFIATVVQQNLAKNRHFEYRRVIQTDNRGDGQRLILERRHLEGDEQMFDHCKEISQMIHEVGNNTTVQLYASYPIPSAPSVLIIDQKHLLFTIPGKKSAIGSTSHDQSDLTTVGALHIEDHTGKLAEDFKRMFDGFCADSVVIANVK